MPLGPCPTFAVLTCRMGQAAAGGAMQGHGAAATIQNRGFIQSMVKGQGQIHICRGCMQDPAPRLLVCTTHHRWERQGYHTKCGEGCEFLSAPTQPWPSIAERCMILKAPVGIQRVEGRGRWNETKSGIPAFAHLASALLHNARQPESRVQTQ